MKRRTHSAKSSSSWVLPLVVVLAVVFGIAGVKQWMSYKKTPIFLSQAWTTYTPEDREYSFSHPGPLVTLGYNDFSAQIPIDGVVYSDLVSFYRTMADAQAYQDCLEESVFSKMKESKEAMMPLNVHHVTCPDDFAMTVSVVKVPKNNRQAYDTHVDTHDFFKKLGKSYEYVDERGRAWNITEYNTMYDKKPFAEICYRTSAELVDMNGEYAYVINMETEIAKLERYLGYKVTDGKYPTASRDETVIPEHKLLVNKVLSSMEFASESL
jgi:hypothetical protein